MSEEETTDVNMTEEQPAPQPPQDVPLLIQVSGQKHEIVAAAVKRVDKDPQFGNKKTIVFYSNEGVTAHVAIDKLEAIVYQ